jgi:hypothetical protein
MTLSTRVRQLFARAVGKKARIRRGRKALRRLWSFEQLEDRVVFANGAAWSVTGSVLDITMMAGKTITVASTASSYTLTVSGLTGTDSNSWTSGSSPYVSASGATATVNSSGKTAFTQINIHETSGQTGTLVAFADSGANSYVTPISVTLADTPGAVTFTGTTSFSSGNSLSVTTNAYITVNSGANVSTVNGNLTLKANVADTSVAGATFAYPGIDVNYATVQVTGTGLLDLEGRGGEGSNAAPIGVYVRSGGQVKGGTSGSNKVLGWGPSNGTTAGNYGVYVYNSTGTTYSTITTNGGDLDVTGTGRGLITAGSDVGAGVCVNGGGVITVGGSGSLDVVGTASTGNSVGGNFGVYVKGAGASSSYLSTITSSGGNVTVTGTGGGTSTASNGWGVAAANGGLISAGGTGTVTVNGTGGTSATGNAHYGVAVTGYYSGTGTAYSTITSSGGTVNITGTGGGSGTAASNAGVALTFGGMVTSGLNASVTVTGTGGDTTASGNYGVYVSSNLTLLTSGGSGTVTVTGYGGGGYTTGSSYATGVYVSQGGTISSGGTGKVMVTGAGNTRTPSTSSANHGIYLASSSSGIARITSGGGDVEISGTGGGAAASGTSAGYGVNVSAGSQVTSGGNGNVTIIGTGAAAAGGTNNYGVNVNGSTTYSSVVYKSTITSGGSGRVNVSGTGGGTGASTSNYGVNVGSSLSTDNGVIISGGNGAVTVTGQGGTTATGSFNYGVYLAGSSVQISSGGTGLVTVTGTGGGTGSGSSNNLGIGLNNNPTITSGAGGSVVVTGQGGTASTTSGNTGIYSSGSFTITCGAGDGTVSVTGTGGGSGASNTNYGFTANGASGSTGLISSGGSGAVTVTGTGGNTSGTNTGTNYGVYLTNGMTISSGGGNVVVNGTGGGNGGASNVGLKMAGISTITAGGSGTVTVNGTGGGSTTGTASNYGVQLGATSGSGIFSGVGGGNVTVNGTEGSGGTGSTVSVGVIVSSGMISTATNGGDLTIKTNSLYLSTLNAIQANSGSSVTIVPQTSGVGFDLGASANILGGPIGISNTELSYFSAGTIKLGNSSTGPIAVSSGMTIPTASNLTLATASTSAGLSPTHSTGSSLTLTSGRSLDLSNVSSLNIAITGTTVGSGYKRLSVAGAPVTLTGMSLNLTGAYSPVGGDVFTIVSAPAGLSGTFTGLAEGDTLNFNGQTLIINYTATTVTLTDAAPKVTTQPGNQTVTYGDAATFTAAASGTPSPTVQWQVNAGSGFSDISGATSTTLSFAPSMSQSGYLYRAVFTNTYGTATSNAATLTVNQASTATALDSSVNPSTYGSSVTFTATVTSGATGTVMFKDGATTLGTGTLSSGTATFSTSILAVASHSITAEYSGDTNYAGSTSSALTQEVCQAVTTTSVASSINPSTYNSSVTFTATVTAGATGTVTFKDGATTLGTGTLNSGTATFSTSTLSVASHSITAVYEGDTNYAGSTSSALTQTVNRALTLTTVASSANPSAAGSSVTFTATVTSGATGTVAFKDGTTTLGTGTLSSGAATFSTSSLPAGARTITAVYQGDTNYAGSTSSTLIQNVASAPVVTVNPSSQAVDVGATCTFTADALGVPTPTVQWQVSTNGGASWSNIAGAKSTSYTTPVVTVGYDGNQYRAVFGNSSGSAGTTAATLRVNRSPSITLQPASVSTNSGSAATFTAATSGWPVPTVQWQLNAGGGWSDITGATNPSYTTGVLGPTDTGNQYRAVFTNTMGNATTNAATLTISDVASVIGVSVGWGTQTASLVDASSGRLLPTGRTNDIPWLGITRITLTLDKAVDSLTAADVTLLSAGGFTYSVSSVTGSGTTWTINLGGGGLINADRITVTIGGSSVAGFSRRLDVLPGDANDDASVTSSDQLLVNRQISSSYIVYYDIDGSGTLTKNDVNLIKARIGKKMP